MSEALARFEVMPAWVDYNGHMNDAAYAKVFSLGVEALSDAIGLDSEGRSFYATTLFTLETHLCYLAEAKHGETLDMQIDVLDRDSKRLHVFFYLHNKSHELVASSEQMQMAMSSKTGKPTAFPDRVADTIDKLFPILSKSKWPHQAGQTIGIRRS